MTGPYEWNPMPEKLALRCPKCAKQAMFSFALVLPIQRKDIGYFKTSSHFDYTRTRDTMGREFNAALFYKGLSCRDIETIDDLPENYSAQNFLSTNALDGTSRGETGVVYCSACLLHQRHKLNWPEEAYFQVEYKRQILWAFDQTSAKELLRFITADDRDFKKFQYRHFLMKVPSHFLKRKARETVTRKLEKLLE